jgi:hypothetical protein
MMKEVPFLFISWVTRENTRPRSSQTKVTEYSQSHLGQVSMKIYSENIYLYGNAIKFCHVITTIPVTRNPIFDYVFILSVQFIYTCLDSFLK